MEPLASLSAKLCSARLRSLEFYLPGDPIELAGLPIADEMRQKLPGIGQEFTFGSTTNSTEMSIAAAGAALEKSGLGPGDIGLVISAPTLTTSYGLEIPAIAVRAALSLGRAECLNIAQGCTGFLAGMRLASQFLAADTDLGNVLVVTACKASTLMDNFSHGAFFWGDAAAATVVTSDPGPGVHIRAYGERSSDQAWGAMRFAHGDHQSYDACSPVEDLKLKVEFADARAQMDYIVGEQQRCDGLISSLLAIGELETADIDSVFLPSIGANRIPHLLSVHKDLRAKVASDFRYAHMGGVDVMFFLDRHLRAREPAGPAWYLALTPAYTAQWGGALLSYQP
jgi:3-oxoacyl-[acyl-carrier-protein] synthase III